MTNTYLACPECKENKLERMISSQLLYGLQLLKEDTIRAFTQDFEQRLSKYGAEAIYDAYMETLIERNDLNNIAKMLQHWSKYLEGLPDCEYTRGANLALLSLVDLCLIIDKKKPQDTD